VVAGDLPGLDADAVMQLLRDDVRCVAVGGDVAILTRIGVVAVVSEADPASLPEAVESAGTRELVVDPEPDLGPLVGEPGPQGRIVAVHGPGGAPGRTTLAIGLAAEHARLREPSVLIDADPHGGAVAQHLGVLDEVSGLLAAARLVNAGSLDAEAFARCRRVVTDGLEVLTGLPRPDRWVEARPGVLDAVLDRAREVGDVVVDTGFSLEDDGDLGRTLSRNQLTIDAVAAADHVVAVGTAEPTGLARLARSLVELRDVTDMPVTVVVNRMRDSLGWSRRDIVGMVEGYIRAAGVHFLPEDRPATDRALVAGKAVVELGDSPLRRGLAEVHTAVFAGRSAQKPPISR
jgi:MinD-like ATPase involved in chromosome partitioning or flagellar assembly